MIEANYGPVAALFSMLIIAGCVVIIAICHELRKIVDRW